MKLFSQALCETSAADPSPSLQILLLISALLKSTGGFFSVLFRLLIHSPLLSSSPPWQSWVLLLALDFHCGDKATRRSLPSAGPLVSEASSACASGCN